MDQLLWLAQHPDLGSAIGEAKREADPFTRLDLAVKLAGYRRDFTLTTRLDRLASEGLRALANGETTNSGLRPLRIALLSSHTVDHLVPAIRVAGLQRRLALSVHVAPYGMYRQALLMDDAELANFAPQLIVLALDARDAPLQLPLEASQADVDAAVAERVDELRLLWRRARERYAAQVVQQTIVPADPPIFGSFEALVPASPYALIDRLNAAIRAAAREDGVLLMDLAWEAARGSYGDGLAEPVRWHQAKQLVSPNLAPLYGDQLARIAAASIGLSRKCLVLDLDNTLWGGVVGDDGVDGIHLGRGSPSGEAFLTFQHYAAQLARRGIILAVCSKNDLSVAEAAFNHPEMALKRSDIAAFVANWEDKAGNLRRIASMLDIGLDSLVFVDDNPAERDIVRRELPEVAVPELPDDVADYPARVAAAGYFEAVSFTSDDAARGRNYVLNAERKAAMSQATDMEGYLRGLEMVLTATPIGAAELARSTQLINKTNQFNLTTRRYSEAEVERIASDPAAVALAIRLADKFGDNGLISVVLARPDAAVASDELLIDSWLMSCRVLGRQVEDAVLDVLTNAAIAAGYRALIGEYRPTERNGMVAEHFPRLGFVQHPAPADSTRDATFWRYEFTSPRTPNHYIEVSA
ncbi:methoxymalonyl-ACP biosynthesis protein [Pseudomonas sp. Choline-3u-10]|jgi:FkbH-like protein|uniref:HAD-IIIC family phosphatase n=2 Tax=Pseudomonadales TaxID=72274 RepID=UPI000617FDBD|nr:MULTISPECIES: HAD-IIIC family phosphatase [Pseudomonadaceae]MAL36239.1 methoxymalonyl-ACP biosynthesis protein [Pseudomonas sp.]MBU0947556.1 HAD-IIIC family phosphatase [Gammaproteobacteria bacterium]KJJ62110.1 methoxymalonyl-ACP biosynthesis protein [Pseudomonas sp. 10B238]MBK3795450.1 HAD-IIIC family phosphatase [Stutzerimonas stutzeri]MBK3878195.1 HAD-IIIC family phosphatase [Stutzerimonas stutzeri]